MSEPGDCWFVHDRSLSVNLSQRGELADTGVWRKGETAQPGPGAVLSTGAIAGTNHFSIPAGFGELGVLLLSRAKVKVVRESALKPVGKPDALIGHVRFDERGWETGRRFASVLAPILDSTKCPAAEYLAVAPEPLGRVARRPPSNFGDRQRSCSMVAPAKKGRLRRTALTFAHTPQKHAYIDRDRCYSLPYKINNLR